jgi:opacity protein-like surface antigen
MRRIHTLTLATLALALALAGTASAQTTEPSRATPGAPDPLPPEAEGFSLTPFIGLGFSGDLENAPASFGVALGWALSPRLSLEGDLSFAPGGEQGLITEFDTSLWSLSGNVLYHFLPPEREFTPYVAGGLGILSGDADVEDVTDVVDDDTSTVFAWNFGGGVKTAMSERWGLRADVRFFNGDDFAPDHWRVYAGAIIRRIGD